MCSSDLTWLRRRGLLPGVAAAFGQGLCGLQGHDWGGYVPGVWCRVCMQADEAGLGLDARHFSGMFRFFLSLFARAPAVSLEI